ncbi:hypothetical protein TRFO_10897 [Tritrichomonas foetus]|uniref:Uncharacterized protein n=1 Tax=Tritrichomonas foetus TaxID=1144522 RepID=A0A1J4J918_9EUKA|nr:hypothetical protein TRFO_10897 [Tritrichomonas foetus]|eukprot:OHS94743.1 hypothetical protein TRFO_10897 [Tritrichomonas foetus]
MFLVSTTINRWIYQLQECKVHGEIMICDMTRYIIKKFIHNRGNKITNCDIKKIDKMFLFLLSFRRYPSIFDLNPPYDYDSLGEYGNWMLLGSGSPLNDNIRFTGNRYSKTSSLCQLLPTHCLDWNISFTMSQQIANGKSASISCFTFSKEICPSHDVNFKSGFSVCLVNRNVFLLDNQKILIKNDLDFYTLQPKCSIKGQTNEINNTATFDDEINFFLEKKNSSIFLTVNNEECFIANSSEVNIPSLGFFSFAVDGDKPDFHVDLKKVEFFNNSLCTDEKDFPQFREFNRKLLATSFDRRKFLKSRRRSYNKVNDIYINDQKELNSSLVNFEKNLLKRIFDATFFNSTFILESNIVNSTFLENSTFFENSTDLQKSNYIRNIFNQTKLRTFLRNHRKLLLTSKLMNSTLIKSGLLNSTTLKISFFLNTEKIKTITVSQFIQSILNNNAKISDSFTQIKEMLKRADSIVDFQALEIMIHNSAHDGLMKANKKIIETKELLEKTQQEYLRLKNFLRNEFESVKYEVETSFDKLKKNAEKIVSNVQEKKSAEEKSSILIQKQIQRSITIKKIPSQAYLYLICCLIETIAFVIFVFKKRNETHNFTKID